MPVSFYTGINNSGIEIIVVDTRDGITKYYDHVPLRSDFSAALKTGISLLFTQEFNQAEYDALLNMVQSQFSVDQIANAAVVEAPL